MSVRILVVEDDMLMRKTMSFILEDSGYKIDLIVNPQQVMGHLKEHAVDLIILDVMLPHINGFVLSTDIRKLYPDVPVIFVSARVQTVDIVEGLSHGADDYIEKPFDPSELIARIQAVLRRYRRAERYLFGAIITVSDVSLDLSNMQFRVPGCPSVSLTPTEMKVLECLMRNANMVVSRDILTAYVWGEDDDSFSNRIDVYIRRLRKKIEGDSHGPIFIHTKRGLGYVFREDKNGTGQPNVRTGCEGHLVTRGTGT